MRREKRLVPSKVSTSIVTSQSLAERPENPTWLSILEYPAGTAKSPQARSPRSGMQLMLAIPSTYEQRNTESGYSSWLIVAMSRFTVALSLSDGTMSDRKTEGGIGVDVDRVGPSASTAVPEDRVDVAAGAGSSVGARE